MNRKTRPGTEEIKAPLGEGNNCFTHHDSEHEDKALAVVQRDSGIESTPPLQTPPPPPPLPPPA
ncbi:hypothetical protein E2C01_015245 [Portunus trituberculatus]|uniref:Uncharacterized protein n=1 Tax=Portunus trituberculatus TaxID=210409 RepID=A0A5B7DMM8_PORTR|nr:hypothetical protein [Portunus trituberculatus]